MSCKTSALIEDYHITLTVNQRLSRYLLRQYDNSKSKQQQGWHSPSILPLASWLKKLWTENTTKQRCLSAWQELNLWRQIIQTDKLNLNPIKTARHCCKAWNIITTWRIPIQELMVGDNTDIRTFAHWLNLFKEKLDNEQWVTECMIPLEINELLKTKAIILPQRILLAGFDEIPPSQKLIIEQIQQSSVVDLLPLLSETAVSQKHEFHDAASELNQALQWAHSHAKKNQSAAIVIPNLAANRHRVERAVMPYPKQLINIAGGNKLSSFPLIQSALDALSLLSGQINCDTAYQWLSSPYLNQSDSECSIGAWLDSQLRAPQEKTRPLNSLITVMLKSEQAINSSWLNRWRNFNEEIRKTPKETSAQNWSEHWKNCLKAIGWPGGQALASEDYQLFEKFKDTLDEFAQLDIFSETISLTTAINLLKQLFQDNLFQAEGSNAPIQILGVLECAGLYFDHMWILGMDSQTWPPPAKPHPFIPIHLQRELKIPHSSAQRELEFCQQIMGRLLQSTKNIHFSWHNTHEDLNLNVSPLLAEFKTVQWELNTLPLTDETNYEENRKKLESYYDDQSLPVGDTEIIRGGSFILKSYATCPFQAFSKVRLQAAALPEPYHGLTPAQKGTLLHSVLENCWREIKDSKTLNSLCDNQLKDLINRQIDTNFREIASLKNLYNWYLDIEKQRLSRLIFDWLQHEKNRSPFKVLHLEKSSQTKLSKLKLNLKIDRVDILENGQTLLIDYKSNAPSTQCWAPTQFMEPQLPLYCGIQNDHAPQAISFAEVKKHQLQFRGISAEGSSGHPNGVKPINKSKLFEGLSWKKLTHQWNEKLEQLAAEFCAGKTSVQPFAPSACDYCDYKSLCRKNQL